MFVKQVMYAIIETQPRKNKHLSPIYQYNNKFFIYFIETYRDNYLISSRNNKQIGRTSDNFVYYENEQYLALVVFFYV